MQRASSVARRRAGPRCLVSLARWAAPRGRVRRARRNGVEALAAHERFSPEVARLDIGLPVIDGYELGRRLKAGPRAARCYLVALTGYGQENDRLRSEAAGFDAHLVKPVDTQGERI